MSTLVICEKNNAASRISFILSNGSSKRSYEGKVPVYRFVKDGEEYAVIGLRGHILNLDYPKKYNEWNKVEPDALIHVDPLKHVHARAIAAAIQRLASAAKTIIVATDYDREGELIGVEALGVLDERVEGKVITRSKFSALTKGEITKAFDNLTEVDYNLAKAGEARQYIDLMWGASLTRFISLTSGQMGKDFLSVGRVQSPTLALLVDREKEIRSFKPEAYWEIEAELRHGPKFEARHAEEPFWEKKAAEEKHARAKIASKAKVVGVTPTEKLERPPIPYSTTLFLADATRQGIGAARAMNVAEDLYTDGWISYPRTDNTVYPRTLSLKYILKKLEESDFAKEAKELLAQERLRPSRGRVSTTDHPPIHPVRGAKKSQLRGERWTIYELVTRRFLATLAPDCKIMETHISFKLNDEPFRCRGVKVLDPGWRKYFPYYKVRENILPEMKRGDEPSVIRVNLLSKETKPPKRYSQATLLKQMEKLGLGTKSTRHEIIQKLFDRGYLERNMIPTETGMAVVEALAAYAGHVSRPEMTSFLEQDMSSIAEGKVTMEKVVQDSRKMLENVFVDLNKNKKELGETIRKATKSQNYVGDCPNCDGKLLTLKSRRGKRFAGCSNYPECKTTYALPQRGKLEPSEIQCKDCGSPTVKVITKGMTPWVTCINIECAMKNRNRKGNGGKK